MLRELSVGLPILHPLWLWAASYKCHKNSIFQECYERKQLGSTDVKDTN